MSMVEMEDEEDEEKAMGVLEIDVGRNEVNI